MHATLLINRSKGNYLQQLELILSYEDGERNASAIEKSLSVPTKRGSVGIS